MADLNRASLMGRLGADPEIRTLDNGDKVANMRIATGERWKDKGSGEQKERTEWHSIVVYGPAAGVVEKYLAKGRRVLVEGAIRTRKWQDKEGADRYSTEIVVSGFGGRIDVIDWPEGQGQGGGAAKGQDDAYGDLPGTRGSAGGDDRGTSYKNSGGGGYGAGGRDDLEDQIPF